jgi:mutator protein MutT
MSKRQGGLWEFPGGKVDSGETDAQALFREMEEEFGTEVAVGERFAESRFEYEFGDIQLVGYRAIVLRGDLTPREHEDVRWVTADELKLVNLAPADDEIRRRILLATSPYG